MLFNYCKRILTVLLLVVSQYVLAQQHDNSETSGNNLARSSEILPPSVNAAALGHYGGIPVGLVTGTPNYTLDLFDLRTTNLDFPVSLTYNASGFKVNDVSQRTGMNWTLNIGGIITRAVYDAADEIATRPAIPLPADKWNQQAHDFWGAVNQNESDGNDLQPDRFSFNLGKIQGQFILDSMNKPILLTNEDVTIKADFSSTDFAFTIATHEGIQYYFGNDSEQSGTLSSGLNCSTYRDYSIQPTAWFLKKIKHPNGDSILLYYSNVHSTYKMSLFETQTRRLRFPNTKCALGAEPETVNPATDASCVSTFDSYTKRLDSVLLSNGFKIELIYMSRLDVTSDYLLSKINYFYTGSAAINKKGYLFQYQTVKAVSTNIYSQVDTTLKYRYFLTNVTERNDLAGISGKIYQFTYNDVGALPARLSYSIDHWGYFNGKSNTTLLYLSDEFQSLNNLTNLFTLVNSGGNRKPDSVFASKGLLSKIIYPTGGYDTIYYGGNLYTDKVEIQTELVNYSPTLQATHNSDATPLYLQTYFRPKKSQTVDLQVNTNYLGNAYEPVLQWITYSLLDSASNSPVNDVGTLPLNSIKITPGDHQSVNVIRGVMLNANQTYVMKLRISGADVLGRMSLSYQDWNTALVDSNLQTGGVKVNKILTYDPVAKVSTTKKFFYAFPENLGKSSLNALDAPTYFLNYMMAVTPYTCSGTYGCPGPVGVSYVVSSNPYVNINQYSGHSVAYPCVIESLGENFENGGIEHRFQTLRDLPPSRLFGNQPMASPFNNNDWFNGKEIYNRKFMRNDNDSLSTVEESRMVYKTHPLFSADFPGYTARRNRISRAYECDMEESGISYVDVLNYTVQKRFNYLDSLSVKSFDQKLLQPITRRSNFRYESKNLQLSETETDNSVGTKIYVRNTYNTDLDLNLQNPVFMNLRNLGFSLPIEVLKIERRADGSEWILEAKLTTFHTQIGKMLVEKVSALDISDPIPLSGFTSAQVNADGNFKYDARYVPKLQLQLYDLAGNVLQQQLPDQTYRSTIFDYNSSLPIAEINFAQYANCAYTSFESNGKGNWSFSGVSTIDGSAPTGSLVYNLSQTNGAISSGPLLASKTYRLTYWLKVGSGTININGSAGLLITKKGTWQLYEKLVSGLTGVTVSGTGIVDELRLVPVEARITTAVYDPLFGVTAYCDERNNISYYQYDALGRLITIRDHDGNILKQVDYQYKAPITK